MSSLIARVHKASVPFEEKLRAACLAAELLARADAKGAQPSTVLSDASETPIASGGLLGDGDSDGEYDVPHLPPRIRARYLELLLEWAISTLVKGSSGASKGGSLRGVGKGSARKRVRDAGVSAAAAADTKFTARQPPHHDARLWRLLRRLLAAGTPAAAVALSEGLLPAMTAACDSLPSEAEGDVGALLVEVLRLLMTEYRASFRPSLEHTASFVAALLPGAAPERQQRRQGAAAWAELTCQALRLLKGVASAHPTQKKVFGTVTGDKLLLPLLRSAFPSGEPSAAEAAQAEEAQSVLQTALLSSSQIPGLSGAAATACSSALAAGADAKDPAAAQAAKADGAAQAAAGEPVDRSADKVADGKAAAAAKGGGAPKHYQRALLAALAAPLAATAAGPGGADSLSALLRALPWMLTAYCAALRTFRRQAAASAEDEAVVAAPAQQKLPPAADFQFFAALATPLLAALRAPAAAEAAADQPAETVEHAKRKRRRTADGAAAQPPAGGGTTWASLARGAAQLLRHVHASGVYRPTADAGGGHRELLARLALAAIEHQSATAAGAADAAAAAELLGAVLDLEHRALQPHLDRIWPLVWTAAADVTAERGCAGAAPLLTGSAPSTQLAAQQEQGGTPSTRLAAQLVAAFAELRQVQALLASLRAAVQQAAGGPGFSAAPVICSPDFLSALVQAVRGVPAGQAAGMVQFVADGLPALVDGSPEVAAPLGEVYVCCLAALQLDSTIAPAVAQTADRIIRQALGGPLSQLLHVALLTGGAPPPPLALLLRLHCAAHRVHAHCAALRPDLAPLASHASTGSAGHFEELAGPGEEAVGLSQLLSAAAGADSAAPAAFVHAAAECAAQRLAVLRERAVRLRYSCPLVTDVAGTDADSGGSIVNDERDAEAALQAAVAESAKLCSWLLARAPSPAELAAATALPAWPGVASSLTAEQLPAALWPYLIQAAASCDQAAEDRLRRFLQACLFSATSPAARNSVLQQVAAASRQWLGSREAREAGHLQPLWPPALAAVLDLALSNSDLKQAASAAGSPGIAAAVSRVPGQQPELSQALLRASQTVDSAAAAFGAAPAAGARLAEPAALQPDAGPLQAAQLLGWAVAAAPALCADDVAAQQLAVCAFAVDTAVSEAVHGGDGSGSAATHTVANHTAAAAATAVLSTSRRLLSAALRSSGGAACAGALWSLQGGAATAWLLSSLRAGPGGPAADAFLEDTVSVLAGMASHALRSAPGHVSAGNHAAARKALKHFSKAMRSDLKSWGSQSMPQRTSVAAAARALLAAAAGTAADTRSNRLQRALADITTATFSWERLQTPAPSSAFLHSEGPEADAATPDYEIVAALIGQQRLEAALCAVLALAARRGQPSSAAEQRADAGLFAAAACALETHAAGGSGTAQAKRGAAAAGAAQGDADGSTDGGSLQGAAPVSADGSAEASPVVGHCRQHLQQASAMLLAMCRSDAAAQPPAPAAVGAACYNAVSDGAAGSDSDSDSDDSSSERDSDSGSGTVVAAGRAGGGHGALPLPKADEAAASCLVQYLQGAVRTLQHNPCAPVAPPSEVKGPAAPSAAAGEHGRLLSLHLRLLAELAPAPAAPRPALHPGSSFWAGIPSAGDGGSSGTGGSPRLRRAVLASLRELLTGAAAEELRATHGALQAGLLAAASPAAALPLLEASLLALETASGAVHSHGLAAQAERFTSGVLTLLSRASHSLAAPYLAALPVARQDAGAMAAALCTALRCLESIAAREALLPLPPHQVASILQVPAVLFGGDAGGASHGHGIAGALGPAAGAGVYVGAARTLAAVIRHHTPVVRRCMALTVASARSLLAALVAWEGEEAASVASAAPSRRQPPLAGGATGSSRPHSGGECASAEQCGPAFAEAHEPLRDWWSQNPGQNPTNPGSRAARREALATCGAALAAAYAAIGGAKELGKYALHTLADYITLALLPAQAAAAAAGAPQYGTAADGADGGGGEGGADGSAVAAALRPGAYALYGACSPAEVQHLYVTLGGKASGRGRTVLADLKRDYEKHYKHSGKV